jgi:hypothetical protein
MVAVADTKTTTLPQSHFWIVWAPEADERRFLAGIPITLLAILASWTNGIALIGPRTIPAAGGFWWILYLMKFGKRLQRRGELGRTILLPGVFILFLLGTTFI